MCGRFVLHTPEPFIAERYFGGLDVTPSEPRYNIAPGTGIRVIRTNKEEAVVFDEAHWGFKPSWAGDDAPSPINARAENVATSGYFRAAFQHHRCLVPANGWYEWEKSGTGGKQPWYITPSDPEKDPVLFFAAIWTPGPAEELSCAIITEPAAATLAFIHPRQPLALHPKSLQPWLDPQITDRNAIRALIHRFPPDQLTHHKVSTAVNRPDHDEAALLDPA